MRKGSKDFFQSIGEYPHTLGIFLTYTLDVEVIEKLTEFSSGSKIIIHDYKHGVCLKENDQNSIVCIPVTTFLPTKNNCFHPKLALLKSEKGAKLIFGSTNLSTSSFLSEKEIALEMELDFDKAEDLVLYEDVLIFLNQISKQQLVENAILEKSIQRLKLNVELNPTKSQTKFIYTKPGYSIFDQIHQHINQRKSKQRAKSIKIATPFVSSEYTFLEQFKELSNEVSIYLRDGVNGSQFAINGYRVFRPKTKKRSGFHAKIVFIEFESDALLYIGSSNFTSQGFFQSLNQSANQECGVLIPTNKNEMEEWFQSKLWNEIKFEQLQLEDENPELSLENFSGSAKYYAWSEKKGLQVITYIYNPDELTVSASRNSGKLKLESVSDHLFITQALKAKDSIVRFYIGEEEVQTILFDSEEFISGLNARGESIFESFKGRYSVSPTELKNALHKEQISVSTSSNIIITEPPVLEQYYYNVKDLVFTLTKKRHFTEYNHNEVVSVLGQSSTGETFYLALQLLKIFSKNNKNKELFQICEQRINELLPILNIAQGNLKTFMKEWQE